MLDVVKTLTSLPPASAILEAGANSAVGQPFNRENPSVGVDEIPALQNTKEVAPHYEASWTIKP
jgi:hypothetical protein